MRILTTGRYLSLATWRRDGREVRTPVWFVTLEGVHYCYTTNDAGKVKRIRRSPRARIAPCTMRGTLLGAWCEARAQLVDDTALCARVYAALRRKYGWQMHLLDIVATLSRRRGRRAVIALEEA
jgi:uncharacterized protein